MTKTAPHPLLQGYLHRIHAEFPEVTWQKAVFNDTGWDHHVVILDNALVFRFTVNQDYRDQLASMVAVLGHLTPKLHVSVPNFTYIASNKSFGGYPIVPGDILQKEVYDALPVTQKSAVTKQLADFLTVLHTQPVTEPAFKDVPKGYMSQDQTQIHKLVKSHLSTMLTKPDYQRVQQIMSAVDKVIDSKTPTTFIHGDVYCSHILWDSHTQKMGIIDFSDMCFADPAIDFSQLYTYGDTFVNELYNYYQGPKDDMLLERAWLYQCWTGVYMMTDYFVEHKTSFAVARQIFDSVHTVTRKLC